MNVVSDHKVVVAIMGIRSVTWGESDNRYTNLNAGSPFFVRIEYKGSSNTFHYQVKEDAYSLFTKIRIAMDKSYGAVTAVKN